MTAFGSQADVLAASASHPFTPHLDHSLIQAAREGGPATVRTVRECAEAERQQWVDTRSSADGVADANLPDAAPTVRTNPLNGNDEDGTDGADANLPHPSALKKRDGPG
jgi:hypothetical protein